ncbi:MAG: four-carbon acid sugar kinase family protein [Verrucomicrobiales bacterium]|nr:four-carbon acid sugar kinase family protein [Verrucomicrobiales bacterium]MCP5556771.1 four-carbon acid sugar kinase family protein [Verrucomicrobiaceae bacterium]
MIAVLADDFSGAAELAGIAAMRGFGAEVQTVFDPASTAEVIAVDCDSRGLSEELAAERVTAIAKAVAASAPEWIYKKTDSVLRGNVRMEIEAILGATGLRKCLFIPANPSKGRVIRGGEYFINGVPLDQTVFASDPDHPRRTSVVRELLGMSNRIECPDVVSVDEVRGFAMQMNPLWLAAGGADFFDQRIGGRDLAAMPGVVERTLLVCGSHAAWESGRAAQMEAQGFVVKVLPVAFFDAVPTSDWVAEMRQILLTQNRLMLAIGSPETPRSTEVMTTAVVAAAAAVAKGVRGLRLAMEGGATAIALMRHCGWTRFEVQRAGLTGVGVLRVIGGEAPVLWVKPGSYPWPDGVFVADPCVEKGAKLRN